MNQQPPVCKPYRRCATRQRSWRDPSAQARCATRWHWSTTQSRPQSRKSTASRAFRRLLRVRSNERNVCTAIKTIKCMKMKWKQQSVRVAASKSKRYSRLLVQTTGIGIVIIMRTQPPFIVCVHWPCTIRRNEKKRKEFLRCESQITYYFFHRSNSERSVRKTKTLTLSQRSSVHSSLSSHAIVLMHLPTQTPCTKARFIAILKWEKMRKTMSMRLNLTITLASHFVSRTFSSDGSQSVPICLAWHQQQQKYMSTNNSQKIYDTHDATTRTGLLLSLGQSMEPFTQTSSASHGYVAVWLIEFFHSRHIKVCKQGLTLKLCALRQTSDVLYCVAGHCVYEDMWRACRMKTVNNSLDVKIWI